MTHLSLRLSFFYITIFFVIGAMMPFWPVWLQAHHMSGIEIGLLMAIPILGKVIFSPLFASLGDRLGERKRLLLFFLACSFFIFAGFGFLNSFTGFLVISILFGISWAPVMSFGDNITLLSIRSSSLQYGRLRLWGSLSFILMSFGFGWILEFSQEELIYWVILTSIALTLLASLSLPDIRIPPLGRQSQPVRKLLKERSFQVFMVSVALIHGSHALYYGFATLHWRSLGYSDGLIGLLWAIGVAAEVVFFIFGARIANHFPPSRLLISAGLCACLRWVLLSTNPDLPVLMIIQTFHAFTFGAMHLGAMTFITRTVSLDLSASAQSLYGAAAFGLGTGVTMLFTGLFYETLGAQAFFLMALMALLGSFSCLILKRYENVADLEKSN